MFGCLDSGVKSLIPGVIYANWMLRKYMIMLIGIPYFTSLPNCKDGFGDNGDVRFVLTYPLFVSFVLVNFPRQAFSIVRNG